MDEDAELFGLDQLIRAYLHQDMALDAPTVPRAVARFARINDAGTARDLERAMDRFLGRFGNDLSSAFARRYGHDFVPEELGMDVEEFFDMVRALLRDPASVWRYER